MSGTTRSRRYGPPKSMKGAIKPVFKMTEQERLQFILDEEAIAAYYESMDSEYEGMDDEDA